MKKNKMEEVSLSEKEKDILKSYQEEYEEYQTVEDEVETIEETVENVEDEVEEPVEEVVENLEEFDFNEEPEEELEEYKEVPERKIRKKKNNNFMLINIIFVVIILLITMIAVDVVAVKKYHKGPYFAILTHKYDDGGTKEYLGLGYKVIKYNQKQGRRDTVIGTWGMKYNNDIIDVEAIDLAIEFNDNESESYKKYSGKFLRVSGVLSNVSMNDNAITITYFDEDGKYTMDIVCNMSTAKEVLEKFETNIRITAIGSVSDYKYKSPENNPTLILSNCFAEQDL